MNEPIKAWCVETPRKKFIACSGKSEEAAWLQILPKFSCLDRLIDVLETEGYHCVEVEIREMEDEFSSEMSHSKVCENCEKNVIDYQFCKHCESPICLECVDRHEFDSLNVLCEPCMQTAHDREMEFFNPCKGITPSGERY